MWQEESRSPVPVPESFGQSKALLGCAMQRKSPLVFASAWPQSFECAFEEWMMLWPSDTCHAHCRSIDDPFAISKLGKTGQIHIFDQANWDSISFIATEDLGRMHDERRFEIIGRKDHSEQRGCNLLLEEFGV